MKKPTSPCLVSWMGEGWRGEQGPGEDTWLAEANGGRAAPGKDRPRKGRLSQAQAETSRAPTRKRAASDSSGPGDPEGARRKQGSETPTWPKASFNQASTDCSMGTLSLLVTLLWMGFVLLGNSWEWVSSGEREDRGVQEECLVSLGHSGLGEGTR